VEKKLQRREKKPARKEPPKKAEPTKPIEPAKPEKKYTGPIKPNPNSKSFKKKMETRNRKRILEAQLEDQFKTGRLYARITSRPGQCGRADGIILEGEELSFYLKKITSN